MRATCSSDGVGAEVLVDGVVDDDDLLRLDVEEMEDVALRRLGDGQDAIRAARCRPHRRARVGVGGAVRQVLRKHQVDAVVNGHDRSAADGRRQHVMRRVVDVRTLAPQDPRHVNLLAQRVVGRRLAHAAEVRPELRGDAQVGLTAEQDVLGIAIDPRELSQQVADVGPDAEVVELPRVDRDAHIRALYRCDYAIPAAPIRVDVRRSQIAHHTGIDAAAASDFARPARWCS